MVIIFRERESKSAVLREYLRSSPLSIHIQIYQNIKRMREMLVDRCLKVDIKNGAIMMNIIIIVFM